MRLALSPQRGPRPPVSPCFAPMAGWLGLVLACLITTPGCDEGADPTARWIDDIEAPLPESLSETGLFARLQPLTPTADAHAYEPPHPLWSSGTGKHRFLHLPAGTTIDTSTAAWTFPVGTVITKTFTYRDIEGRTGEVAIETRLLFRRAAGWEYAQYHWNREGTEARLREPRWPELGLALSYGAGLTFPYTLPGALDCAGCHEARADQLVLGISELNLPDSLRPLLTGPARALELDGRTPEERAAMAYLAGNCGHCHHGGLGNDNAAFSLLPADLLANTINQPTESSASGDGIRVVPGDAEGSALFEAVVTSREPGYAGNFKPMPPLGIDQADPEAARILRAWIEGLDP